MFQIVEPLGQNVIRSFDCPAGKSVLSGGWRGLDGFGLETSGFRVWESYPEDHDTWSFRTGSNPPSSVAGDFGEFLLVCATVN